MPPVTEAAVLDALRPIVDPDFGKSIVDLGFIQNLRIQGGAVSFTIELTTPACPVKAEFERAARERVSALPGVASVAVTMEGQAITIANGYPNAATIDDTLVEYTGFILTTGATAVFTKATPSNTPIANCFVTYTPPPGANQAPTVCWARVTPWCP